jgi:hypothetical protein
MKVPLRLALTRNPPLPQAGEDEGCISSPACGRGVAPKA